MSRKIVCDICDSSATPPPDLVETWEDWRDGFLVEENGVFENEVYHICSPDCLREFASNAEETPVARKD